MMAPPPWVCPLSAQAFGLDPYETGGRVLGSSTNSSSFMKSIF
jgi:hypothetical protein